MVLATVCTPGSIAHIDAPTLITVADARFRIPANIAIIWAIKKTAKVIPTINAVNFVLSFTSSLGGFGYAPHYGFSGPGRALLVGIDTLAGAMISTLRLLLLTISSSMVPAAPGFARNSTSY